MWKSLKAGIEKCVVRKRIRLKRKRIGEKDWWDAECMRRKKQVKKAYSRWREGKKEKGRYQIMRREFRKLCRRKEEERREKLEEEVRNCRTKTQIWRIINRERKRVILRRT